MTREVYTDKRFIEFSRRLVFVRVFQDIEPQGERLASKFEVDGFPTLIVLDPSGHEVDRILGFKSPQDLIEELKEITEEDGRIKL
jgi:thioredoxin-related protein